ncbi:CRE-LIN-42 protein [Caenorhabditis remanei]|uniref:CRE-LIN-42 protein n=1 Tax=Caenorhabditis remanei TaxID=31234 RepID=E3MDP6_CAERE|nr:CRE-LIN-42 protein [Caenorhabditis remanei]
MEPAGHSSATSNTTPVPQANPPQPTPAAAPSPPTPSTPGAAAQPSVMREDGATLSPPNTWSSSSVEYMDDADDNRLLFTCTFTLPHGTVLSSATYTDNFNEQYLPMGTNFLARLEPKGQSFILSAAAASVKQRIFARVAMPDGNLRACELLCEFEQDRAKITVLALRSAFNPQGATVSSNFHVFTFITKHSSTCALTHIDYASIPYLGLLPTDLIGKSLLAFVYSPDVHVVRQAHVDLHNSRGKIVKSIADLRLVAHNGSILRCQTEWSAYVNPWTRKMELVVARHRICSLPIGDADVISSPPAGIQTNTLPPVMAKTFEDELRTIMNKPVPSTSRSHQSLKEQHQLIQLAAGFPTTTDLGAYIDKIVEQLVVNSTAQQQQKVAVAAAAAAQAAQAAVVATAQIRKVASAPPTTSPDPPLSYTQINCLENVHRLLKSQSRPESPAKQDEPFDEKKYPPQTPLTREALSLHTKRFEDEYKDTWCRRLKRLSDDVPSSPPAKQSRPSGATPINWATHQKQDYYRTMAPAPPPPPGKNYQITYTPLDDPTDQKSTNTKSDVENLMYPVSGSKFSTPMRLSIDGGASTPPPLVQRLLLPRGATSTGGASPTSGSNSPPAFPKTSSSSSLLMLRDSQN